MEFSLRKDSLVVALSSRRLSMSPLWADVLRLLALVSMIVDHAAKSFATHGQDTLSFMIGRMAFPIFLAMFGIHWSKSRSAPASRCLELVCAAILTQPLFDLALSHHFNGMDKAGGVNILYSFFILGLALWAIEKWRWDTAERCFYRMMVLAIFLWLGGFFLINGGYGWFGLVSGVGFYLCAKRSLLWLPLAFIPMIGFANSLEADGMCYLAGLMVVAVGLWGERVAGAASEKRFLPRKFFIVVYAGHLAALAALSWLFVHAHH